MDESVGCLESAEARFFKQGGRCSLCGKEIVFENYEKGDRGAWQLHHIDGKKDNNALDNLACVCINEPQNCYLNVVHDGDFNTGTLAPKKWFRLQGWDPMDLSEILNYRTPIDIFAWHIAND